MTTDLEKQFFDAFGIEPFIYCSKPRLDCDARSKGFCRKDCEYYSGVLYPQITDRILLELICIVAEYYCFRCDNWVEQYKSVDKLKSFILLELIGLIYQKEIKQQVQALFKEG